MNILMTSTNSGEELSQLSRLLFDSAADKWYLALSLQMGAGIAAAILGVMSLPGNWSLAGAMAVTAIMSLAYGLRLRFSQQYSMAEAMRRQSVLTEALGMAFSKTQMSVWRQRAGERIRKRVKVEPLAPDYYATKKNVGAAKLAEMTIESAFYTRYLYCKLRTWAWIIFVAATLTAAFIVSVALMGVVPTTFGPIIAKVLYSLVPVALAVDLLGWGIKLGWITAGIQNVEAGLEQLAGSRKVDLSEVMRYVSEYNCQVVGGLPIHNWLFKRWHGEISDHWQQRG